MQDRTEGRAVDRDTVERTKGKLMQKAAEKRSEKKAVARDTGVETARRRYEENRRLQNINLNDFENQDRLNQNRAS
jgi:hypothetical protein